MLRVTVALKNGDTRAHDCTSLCFENNRSGGFVAFVESSDYAAVYNLSEVENFNVLGEEEIRIKEDHQ